MNADDQITVDRAIEIGKQLLWPRRMTLAQQSMLVRRFSRLSNSLGVADNLLVRRALGFPLACGTHTCGDCDECWYDRMAEKLVEESIATGKNLDLGVDRLREIAREVVRRSRDMI